MPELTDARVQALAGKLETIEQLLAFGDQDNFAAVALRDTRAALLQLLEDRAATEVQGLKTELQLATQTLIDVVQRFGGEIGQDWSSWRVGFGYGVCRGEGTTDDQQIVSAIRQCLELPVPERFKR